MYRVMIAAITGNATWDFDSLQCPGFRHGQDWETLGVPADEHEPASGKQVVDIALEHDMLVLQHYPSADFIKRLKDVGVGKVLLWTDTDAIPATRYWSPRQWPVWQMMLNFRLVGTRHNRFGHQMVDHYEASENGPLGKPHTWAIDVGASRFPSLFCEVLGNLWEKEGYRGLVDGVWFDNMLQAPYFGTATNAPIVTPDLTGRHVYGLKTMLQTCRKIGFGEIWGNCGSTVHHYPELDGKWDELAFTVGRFGMWGDKIKESFQGAAEAGNPDQHYVYGTDGPGTDRFALNEQEAWSKSIGRVADEHPGRVGCVTARTSRWAFVPPPCAKREGVAGGRKVVSEPAEDQGAGE